MHTHDMENHDNLYADEIGMVMGETAPDARGHALMAAAAIAAMVVVLMGVTLILF